MTRRGWRGEAAKAVGVLLIFFVLVDRLNADLETDFPELLVLFLVVSLLFDPLRAGGIWAWRRLRGRHAGVEPVLRRPHEARRALLIVLVGLPILVVVLLAAARVWTTSWSVAGERVAVSTRTGPTLTA
jgi:hypothetical protein